MSGVEYLVLVTWALHLALPVIVASFMYRNRQIEKLKLVRRNLLADYRIINKWKKK